VILLSEQYKKVKNSVASRIERIGSLSIRRRQSVRASLGDEKAASEAPHAPAYWPNT